MTVDVGAALDALGEPRRRAILGLVRDEPRSVNDIAAELEISQQAVSRHLQLLKGAGLVTMQPDAQRRLYVVRPEGLESVATYLSDFWPRRLSKLKSVVEGRRSDRD